MEKTKSYNEATINLLNSSILNDEFNDASQNENAYDGMVSGQEQMDILLNLAYSNGLPLIEGPVLNVGSGQQKLFVPGKGIKNLEPCPSRKNENAIIGWAENIMSYEKFSLILCWGTFCFVRSIQETLVEFNKVLSGGGFLIVDVVTDTTMPLAQTVNPDSFVRFTQMFGFEMYSRIKFGWEGHMRVGLLFRKFENFNVNRLRMPQTKDGVVLNYLPQRDWFLK